MKLGTCSWSDEATGLDTCRSCLVGLGIVLAMLLVRGTPAAEAKTKSHPPQRPLPKAMESAATRGPAYYVDPMRGDDTNDGSIERSWKTLQHGVRQLEPGDTLYLRQGIYYETVYVYRNVFDQRAGVYYGLPGEDDPSGAFLHHEGHLISDHGSPVYPVMRVYHNTFLRREPVWRDYFLFGLGAVSLRDTERDVFNNLFVQADRIPGAVILGKEAGPLREGGNLLWGVNEGPTNKVDPFARLRNSPLWKDTQRFYEPGWTTNDTVADPKFARLAQDSTGPSDLRLTKGSPAIDAGQSLPATWPDPLREMDKGKPDIGAIPLGTSGWGVGVDGRICVFGDTAERAPHDESK